MSMTEKNRRTERKGESRAHSTAHKHDGHKMAAIVNHNHSTRSQGIETPKPTEKKIES